jgi:integrase
MRKSLVIRRAGSPYWFLDFQINGRRFRDSTKEESRAKAEEIALRVYTEEKLRRGARRAEWSLSDALGKYWEDRGSAVASAAMIAQHSATLIKELGERTIISDLTTMDLSSFVARRRQVKTKRYGKVITKQRANATVNREVGHLRTVLLAARSWGARVPEIHWKTLWLPEPDKVQLILSDADEERFFQCLRPDFWPIVEFALLTGVRLENVLGLTWRQIDWDEDEGRITFRTKSKKPGGALHVVPLTDAVRAVLARERGNHPEMVFTYVCARNRHDPHTGIMQEKGERYPFSHDGWRREWDRARCEAGLPGLRFHDLRHTAATRTLVAVGNLKIVQKLLGHADIATTMRYTAIEVADVRAAMEKTAAARVGRKARVVA